MAAVGEGPGTVIDPHTVGFTDAADNGTAKVGDPCVEIAIAVDITE